MEVLFYLRTLSEQKDVAFVVPVNIFCITVVLTTVLLKLRSVLRISGGKQNEKS